VSAQRSNDEFRILARYLAEIADIPLLSREEERRLADRIGQGSKRAVDRLVSSNLGFVVKIATEYRNLGLPFEDLLNEGNLGLIEAAYRFDATKGNKFITYAMWWIRKSILKALSEKSRLVRVPSTQSRIAREVYRAEQALRAKLGRAPTGEELSRDMGTDRRKIERARRSTLLPQSLDEPIRVGDDDSRVRGDLLEDPGPTSPESKLLDREETDVLLDAFDDLTEVQSRVLTRRYGLDGEAPMTLQELGERMGLSRERVRQIENNARMRLRRLIRRRLRP